MRILFVNQVGIVSGAEKVALSILDSLDPKKFRPVFACPPHLLLEAEVTKKGITCYPIPEINLLRNQKIEAWLTYIARVFQWAVSLTRVIKAEQIEVIHANSFTSALYAILPARICRVPLVWHMHDSFRVTPFNRLLVRWASLNVSAIISVSNASAARLRELGAADAKISVVHNFAFGLYNSSKLSRSEARLRLNIPDPIVLIGMVGQLAEWKGQHVFIQALGQLLNEGQLTNVKALIVGDIISQTYAPDKAALVELTTQCGLAHIVEFMGFRTDVADLMRAFDILVHASIRHDPSPVVLGEGMANQCCIVASAVGGVPETIEDGVSGILIPPGAVGQLAAELGDLIRSPEQRRTLAEGAFQRMKSFRVDVELAKLTTIYDNTRHVRVDPL